MPGSIVKRGLLAGVAAAVAGFFFLAPPGWRDTLVKKIGGEQTSSAAPAAARPPVVVRAQPVRTDTFEDRVEAIGTLRANESVLLTPPVTDIVSAVHFEDGARVEKDQILVEMVTLEERALRTEAISNVAESKAQFERARDLASRKFTSESLLDQRRREYETAQARLKAIEARMEDRVIRAPFSGTIGLRTVSVGALLEPNTTIARIEDDSIMKLDFSVPSTFLASLKPGLPITAHARGFEGETFKGDLASIDNTVDEVTRTIRVRALIPNADRRLKPGLLMTIDLFRNPRETLVLPEEALVPAGGTTYVFVVDRAQETVERRQVVMGARRAGEIEIKDGLKAGEWVVTEGSLKLRPGAKVKLKDESPAETPAASDNRESSRGRS